MKHLTIIAILLAALVLVHSRAGIAAVQCDYDPGALLRFHTEGRFIRDQYGRAALLRGANVPLLWPSMGLSGIIKESPVCLSAGGGNDALRGPW